MMGIAQLPLAGRVALVTGAGSGIGRGTAIALAADGAGVAVTDIQMADASETARMIEAAGGKALALSMDVTKFVNVENGFAAAAQHFGPVDICVASAGANEHKPGGNTLLNMDLDGWDRLLQLNLTGALYAARAAASGLLGRGWGRIIFIGSAAGWRLAPGGGGYAVAKAGLAALTKMLARELGSENITVNSVAPFFVDTPMLRKQIPDDETLEQQMREGPLANPMRVVLQVEDQVAAVLYLCRQSGRYVTGQTIHVDGGSVMP